MGIKNISLLILFVILSTRLVYAQEMYVAAGGEVTVSAGDALYINNNLTVDGSGNLTVMSDNNKSGSLLVTGTSSGDIIYKRDIANSDWHLVSAPVTTQSIDGFDKGNNFIATNNDKYAIAQYNNANQAGTKWEYYTTTTAPGAGSFISAKGYSTKRTEGGYYTFEGELATSDVDYSITTSSGSHYWACVGNPYPTYMLGVDGGEIASLLKNNIDNLSPQYLALYVWNGAAYETVNFLSARTYFTPGQAFMVKGKSANETFTFSKVLQSHQSGNNTFHRTMEHPTIELYLNVDDKEKSTTLKYTENSTLGLDPGYDAGAFQDGSPEFSINTHLLEDSEGVDITVQCLPNDNLENNMVPVSVNATAGATLNFSATHSDFPEELHIYLEDVLTSEIINLKEEDYQVSIQSDLQGIGRFYLYTTQEELSVTPEVLSSISIYSPDNKELIITGLQGSKKVDLNIYNALGQKVYTHQFTAEQKINLNLPSVPSGVYITELATTKGVHSKKLIFN